MGSACVLKQQSLKKRILSFLLYQFMRGSGSYLLDMGPTESSWGCNYCLFVIRWFGSGDKHLVCDLTPVLQVLSISHTTSPCNVIATWQML